MFRSLTPVTLFGLLLLSNSAYASSNSTVVTDGGASSTSTTQPGLIADIPITGVTVSSLDLPLTSLLQVSVSVNLGLTTPAASTPSTTEAAPTEPTSTVVVATQPAPTSPTTDSAGVGALAPSTNDDSTPTPTSASSDGGLLPQIPTILSTQVSLNVPLTTLLPVNTPTPTSLDVPATTLIPVNTPTPVSPAAGPSASSASNNGGLTPQVPGTATSQTALAVPTTAQADSSPHIEQSATALSTPATSIGPGATTAPGNTVGAESSATPAFSYVPGTTTSPSPNPLISALQSAEQSSAQATGTTAPAGANIATISLPAETTAPDDGVTAPALSGTDLPAVTDESTAAPTGTGSLDVSRAFHFVPATDGALGAGPTHGPMVASLGAATVSLNAAGAYMLGSLTLAPGSTVTQGAGQNTAVVGVEVEHGTTELVLEDASTTITSRLGGFQTLPSERPLGSAASASALIVDGHTFMIGPASLNAEATGPAAASPTAGGVNAAAAASGSGARPGLANAASPVRASALGTATFAVLLALVALL